MVRINIDTLESRDGLYFFNGEIFEGIGYEIAGHRVVGVFMFEKGARREKLHSEISPGIQAQGVLSKYLAPDEQNYDGEPVVLDGTPYTGLAYEFKDQFCVCEELYKDGRSIRAITWYRSGDIASYEIWDEEVTQDIGWYENGQVEFVRYIERDSFEMELRSNKNGLIKAFRLYGAYFKKLGAIKNRLKLNKYDMNYIENEFSADQSIYMSGDGVDDTVLRSMITSKGLSGVKRIDLFNTAVTAEGIDYLSRLDNLEHLICECHDCEDMESALVHLREKNSRLVIEYNGAMLNR